MPGRLVADDVEYRRSGAPGIVEVGNGVPEPRAEVENGHGGAPGNSPVSVCRSGRHTFEENEDWSGVASLGHRRDERKFGGTGIRKADAYSGRSGCCYQGFRTGLRVHRVISFGSVV
jgi:hypothetical protein